MQALDNAMRIVGKDLQYGTDWARPYTITRAEKIASCSLF